MRAGSDSAHSESLPGQVCPWPSGNLLGPSLAAGLQAGFCPGGPFRPRSPKQLLPAVPCVAAHLSTLCPPHSWRYAIRPPGGQLWVSRVADLPCLQSRNNCDIGSCFPRAYHLFGPKPGGQACPPMTPGKVATTFRRSQKRKGILSEQV